MHIPDGFLNNGTASSLIGVAAAITAYAVNKVRRAFFVKEKIAVLKTPEGIEFGGSMVTKLTQYGRSKIFKMLTLSVFIFGTQFFDLFNLWGFPVHFLGGALAAIILGPLEGFLVIVSVLIIQCLVLGDGGFLALGANIFNMGVIGTIGSYYVYRAIRKRIKIFIATFFAAFIGALLAVFFYSGELWLSSVGILSFWQTMFTGIFAGLTEGLLTAGFLSIFRYKKIDFFQFF